MTALDVAKNLIGIRESGPNTDNGGPIDQMLKEVGAAPGDPWCAAFASHCFRKAGASNFPFSAGSQNMLARLRTMGLVSSAPDDLWSWNGALIIRTDPGGEHGHVALVGERYGQPGRLIALGTYEGNTNPDGGSNGNGAYHRRREIPLEPYVWHFVNTSGFAGGAWW